MDQHLRLAVSLSNVTRTDGRQHRICLRAAETFKKLYISPLNSNVFAPMWVNTGMGQIIVEAI